MSYILIFFMLEYISIVHSNELYILEKFGYKFNGLCWVLDLKTNVGLLFSIIKCLCLPK